MLNVFVRARVVISLLVLTAGRGFGGSDWRVAGAFWGHGWERVRGTVGAKRGRGRSRPRLSGGRQVPNATTDRRFLFVLLQHTGLVGWRRPRAVPIYSPRRSFSGRRGAPRSCPGFSDPFGGGASHLPGLGCALLRSNDMLLLRRGPRSSRMNLEGAMGFAGEVRRNSAARLALGEKVAWNGRASAGT